MSCACFVAHTWGPDKFRRCQSTQQLSSCDLCIRISCINHTSFYGGFAIKRRGRRNEVVSSHPVCTGCRKRVESCGGPEAFWTWIGHSFPAYSAMATSSRSDVPQGDGQHDEAPRSDVPQGDVQDGNSPRSSVSRDPRELNDPWMPRRGHQKRSAFEMMNDIEDEDHEMSPGSAICPHCEKPGHIPYDCAPAQRQPSTATDRTRCNTGGCPFFARRPGPYICCCGGCADHIDYANRHSQEPIEHTSDCAAHDIERREHHTNKGCFYNRTEWRHFELQNGYQQDLLWNQCTNPAMIQ